MNLLSVSQKLLGMSIPVLCYHQVRPRSGMTPEKFGSHLDLLTRMGLCTVGLATLHRIIRGEIPAPGPSVAITFDDCTLDNWVYAMPELHRRGMTGTFFAITDFLQPGKSRARSDQGAVTQIPDFGTIMHSAMHGDSSGFMNHDELRAAEQDLGMEIYAHSAAHQGCFISRRRTGVLGDRRHWSHAALSGKDAGEHSPVYPVGSAYAQSGFGRSWSGTPLDLETNRPAFCLQDFSRSKATLEKILGHACPYLCLPWGQYDAVTLDAASQTGFSAVLSLEGGHVSTAPQPDRIGRLAVKDSKSSGWLCGKSLLLAHTCLAGLVRGERARGNA